MARDERSPAGRAGRVRQIGPQLGPFWVRVQFLTRLLAPWGHHRFAIVSRQELTGVAARLRITQDILTRRLRRAVDSESSIVTRAFVHTEIRAQLDRRVLPFNVGRPRRTHLHWSVAKSIPEPPYGRRQCGTGLTQRPMHRAHHALPDRARLFWISNLQAITFQAVQHAQHSFQGRCRPEKTSHRRRTLPRFSRDQASQSSSFNPGTRENSAVLWVTTLSPPVRAIATICRS